MVVPMELSTNLPLSNPRVWDSRSGSQSVSGRGFDNSLAKPSLRASSRKLRERSRVCRASFSSNGYAGGVPPPPIPSYSRSPSFAGQIPDDGSWRSSHVAGVEWSREGGVNRKLKLFSGRANPALAKEVAQCMGLDLGQILIKRFADGELYVQVQESVRGCDVFLIQPTCPPANENLMELLVMIDACRRASAKTITAVIPYFGYARADRKTQGRESIAAKLVANLLTSAGADRVLACDLHSGQSVGYFDIPVDQVYGQPVILDYLASKMMPRSQEIVVVSPDVGGVTRARAFAKKLSDAPLAIVDKRRQGHNIAEVMNLIGDVKGKVAIMVDDMIDTAGTIFKGAQLLREAGAAQVFACCTHPVFSPPAIERLSSGLFEEVITTNTIPLAADKLFPQLTILSMANLLGEAIWRIHDESCSHPSAAALDID